MHKSIQLDLFEKTREEQSGDTEIDWSYSRRLTLTQCARRYYYNYYGGKTKLALMDPKKKDIVFLSKLSNRHMRSGDILHIAIRLYYKHGVSSGDWLLDWASRIYRSDYNFSKAADLPLKENQYPPVMLLEFYYNQPDADRLYAESEKRLLDALSNFLTCSAYSIVRNAGFDPNSEVEKRISVRTSVFSGRGKVDLAFPWKGKFKIVDWKLGEVEAKPESLQLAFYALWAMETKKHSLEDIALYYGYLTDGSLRPVVLNEQTLLHARARIVQDLERMYDLDEYGWNATAEAFPECSFPEVCKLCPYQGLCHGATGLNKDRHYD